MIFAMQFQIFTFKDPNLAEYLTNFAATLKIVGPRRFQRACFFQFQGPLTFGGARAPPSVKGSGGQDCQGRVEGRGLVEH